MPGIQCLPFLRVIISSLGKPFLFCGVEEIHYLELASLWVINEPTFSAPCCGAGGTGCSSQLSPLGVVHDE